METKIKTNDYVSMDDFKEMIAIEKAFGPLKLGHLET